MSDAWIQSPELSGHQGMGITLVEGSTFCISSRTGDIYPHASQGFFYEDSRFISSWEMLINGKPLQSLSVVVDDPFEGKFISRAHPRSGHGESTILVFRTRNLGLGLREEILIRNFAEDATVCVLEFVIDADFAGIFEVKENRVAPKGEFGRSHEESTLTIRRMHDNFERSVEVAFSEPMAMAEGNRVMFEPVIEGNSEWHMSIEFVPSIDSKRAEPRFKNQTDNDTSPAQQFVQWRNTVPLITTNHIPLATAVRQGQEDLGSLRMFDAELSNKPVIAAGAPWFMTLFGRDSLLTSWMALIVDPSLAIGVLEALAKFQGTKVDENSEEQPGRILHEMRPGGGDALGFDKSNVYYGSVDATPLFVMLLGELRRWGLAHETTERLLPHADRALEWIETYGDRDGDGYVEYQRMTDRGLQNQVWKDSWDSMRFADGTPAETPIAAAEVQAYVYAAYQARKWFARETGDHETAEKFRTKARELKLAFNRDFWLEDRGYLAMGLDKNKRPLDAKASNMGHCLWTGIVDEDKAKRIADVLVSDAMFSGWGVRTLGSDMRGFNPIGYHTGSVWPHDTAIAAAGLSRYGFVDEARKLIMALLDASMPSGGRLPELFSGLERSVLSVPVNFPTSCSPQAWAAASPLLALRTLLRFDPSVPQGHLVLDPNFGPDVIHFRLDRIPFAGRQISIEISDGEVNVEGLDANIRVIRPESGRNNST